MKPMTGLLAFGAVAAHAVAFYQRQSGDTDQAARWQNAANLLSVGVLALHIVPRALQT